MHRSSILILGALLFLLIYKFLRFDALGYSFNDMYAFVQMSCSWIDGRPFMYDNIWGYHHKIHNYYTVLLWGPFCYYFGAKGLFAIQVALLLLAYGLVNRQLMRLHIPDWARTAVLIVGLLGPVAFWLNDHPNIGWHTELTYLPAALLWAVTLGTSRNFAYQILAGLFIVLIKEDGAVLALLIHLSAVVLRYVAEENRRSAPLLIAGLLKQRQFWVVAVGWTVVFVAGMVWLAAKNNFAEPRLRNALALMASHAHERAFWKQNLTLLAQSLLLLIPMAGLIALLTASVRTTQKIVIWGLWLVGVGTLTVLNFVQSAHYIDQFLFYLVSFTWPPRFVLLWGFSMGYVVLLVAILAPAMRPVPSRLAWYAGAFLWLIQLPLLSLARPDLPGLDEWKAAFVGPPGANMNRQFLDPDDLKRVQSVAANLPPRSNVFAFDYVVPYFHRHYGIWPTGNEWQKADIAIMARPDIQRIGHWRKVLLPAPVDSVQLNHYTIYFRPPFANTIRQSVGEER